MVICGLKLTHDASLALMVDGRLRGCVELEKLNNNPRHCGMDDLAVIPPLLAFYGLTPMDIDRFVIDGWHGTGPTRRASPQLSQRSNGREIILPVAGYNEAALDDDVLARCDFTGALPLGAQLYDYRSYTHAAGHIMGSYCASPFAQSQEPAYVLVWDGGQYPRLYYVDPMAGTIDSRGSLFPLRGTLYGIMGYYFGPYRYTEQQFELARQQPSFNAYFGGFALAGKLMSYIGLGDVQPELLRALPAILQREQDSSILFEHRFLRAISKHAAALHYADADVLLTLHVFIERLLLDGLKRRIQNHGPAAPNLCLSGGAALNIKWNSAIRKSGLFRSVWVPPFPNDAGSAIGTACCEMALRTGFAALDWDVYSGPTLRQGALPAGWQSRPCDLADLARLLVERNEPIVFLNGPAELGPRALGNRSILAPANDARMKLRLNHIKQREDFRPVAPICMEEYAAAIFDPGTPDPFMVFDHQVREGWRDRVPAICHLDGTARLQSVNASENPAIHQLLKAYHALTGIPLLCNTSANRNGAGFFPDAESAMRWGGVGIVYAAGILYERLQ